MTIKEADNLYARFLEGNTDMQDEQLLSEWIKSGDCPPEWLNQREILPTLLPHRGSCLPQGTLEHMHRALTAQAYPKSSHPFTYKRLYLALSGVAAAVALFFGLFQMLHKATPVASPAPTKVLSREKEVKSRANEGDKQDQEALPGNVVSSKSGIRKETYRVQPINLEKLRREEDLLNMAVQEEQAQLELAVSRVEAEAERYVLETVSSEDAAEPSDKEDDESHLETDVTPQI